MLFTPEADANAPPMIRALAPAEQLLVRSLRHWIVALRDGSSTGLEEVWSAFAAALGTVQARPAVGAFAATIREIRHHPRRRIRHHAPCCPMVAPDELAILGCIAACQRGDWPLAQARAEWLVRAEGVGGFLAACGQLATMLQCRGLELPARAGVMAESATVH